MPLSELHFHHLGWKKHVRCNLLLLLHVVHIFILRWFYVLDHLKARNHADIELLYVFSV